MRYSVAKGKEQLFFELPEQNVLAVLQQNDLPVGLTGVDSVRAALASPIGAPRLRECVKAGEKIAIITSDLTRPLPSHLILPEVLDELEAAGCALDDCVVVFALGSHRPQSEAEMRRLVGDAVYEKVRCLDSDLSDVLHLGVTRNGTPVDVTRVVAEADRRICLGNIEYHYFAGYSGGAKAIMPGVSTREAIQANHSRMVDPGAFAGNLDGNPVRRDIEEAIDFCPIDFIVNVVLDEHKQIIHTVAGHFIQAHRAGCAFLDQLYLKPIPRRADIVVVSQGGAPKDLNLYQTQKALDNAKHAVKSGGVIILVGSCVEGMGEEVFEEWMCGAEKPEDLISRIRSEFRLGGHKAAAIALVLAKADIFLVSDMDDSFVKSIFMTPFKDLQSAIQAAFERLGPDASALIMPYGGSTLPCVADAAL